MVAIGAYEGMIGEHEEMVIFSNVLIPTVAEHVVIMLILLVPVVLIEAVVLARRHRLKYGESFGLTFQANLRSTLVGLPLGYLFALCGIIPAGLFAALLPEHLGSLVSIILFNAVGRGGSIPGELDEVGYFLGTLLVLIPYFYATLRVERKYLVKRKPGLSTPALLTTVRIMNDITYGILMIPIVVGSVFAVIRLRSL
jgi:hypothetical protein